MTMYYTQPRLRSMIVHILISILFLVPVVVSAGAGGGAADLTNPLKGTCDELAQCLTKIVQYVLGLAAIVALAFIVYGGFLYITSAGNEDQLKSGKNAVYGAVVGLVVIGLAFAIVEFVASALGAGGGGGGQNVPRPRL